MTASQGRLVTVTLSVPRALIEGDAADHDQVALMLGHDVLAAGKKLLEQEMGA